MTGQTTLLVETLAPAAVQLLHDRPELRDSFPIADQVDMAVRAGA
jgi:hypothetical protein